MPGMLLALLVAAVGVGATVVWFGLLRRRKLETEIGIQALANLKWRDCIAVVLEALHRDGYQRSAVAEVPSGGATEVMLTRGGEDVLLEYKHGTAYHLSDANVREFINNVSLNGARQGLLVTLGTIGPAAAHVAATHNVQLIDGRTLWPKVRHYLVPSLFDGVRNQASARTRAGLWGGLLASALAGAVVFVLLGDRSATQAAPSVAEHELDAAIGTRAPLSPDAEVVAKLSATAKALEAIGRLSPEQLAVRRAQVAKSISDLPRVGMAAWSGQRTLLVNLDHPADEPRDGQLLEEVCRILIANEEMRFTRVQLQLPTGSGQRVRWRLCE